MGVCERDELRVDRLSLSEPLRACLCPLHTFHITTMAEFTSPVDSSFVLVGTDQSQVLPLSRPPTVTSDTTFPSSISTPTSPIDSNVSSLGTLEVLIILFHLSPPDNTHAF
jgi:hypothetical protein